VAVKIPSGRIEGTVIDVLPSGLVTVAKPGGGEAAFPAEDVHSIAEECAHNFNTLFASEMSKLAHGGIVHKMPFAAIVYKARARVEEAWKREDAAAGVLCRASMLRGPGRGGRRWNGAAGYLPFHDGPAGSAVNAGCITLGNVWNGDEELLKHRVNIAACILQHAGFGHAQAPPEHLQSVVQREAFRFLDCIAREQAALATGTKKDNPSHRHPCTQIPTYARRGTAADASTALGTAALTDAWPSRSPLDRRGPTAPMGAYPRGGGGAPPARWDARRAAAPAATPRRGEDPPPSGGGPLVLSRNML